MNRWFQLYNVEWIKARSQYAFVITIAAQLIIFLVIVFIAANFDIHVKGVSIRPFFQFPHVWDTFAWLLGWLNLFTAIGFISIVGTELGDRTFHFQLVSGLTRMELVLSKILLALVFSAGWSLVFFGVGLGFGLHYSSSVASYDIFLGLELLLAYFLRTVTVIVAVMLITFLVRNLAVSVLIFVLMFSISPVIHSMIPESVGWMLPFGAMQNLTPMPDFLGLAILDHPEFNALKSSMMQVEPSIVKNVCYSLLSTLLYLALFIWGMLTFIRKKSF